MQARLDARVMALVTTDRSLVQARTDEQSDAHGSHDDELERVPACPQHDEVQPARAAVGCRARADAGDQDVRKRDQHRGYPPLESATCADGSEQSVARHVAEQVVAGANAERPDKAEHVGPLVTRVTPSRRQNVCECPKAVPEDPQYEENLPHHPLYAGGGVHGTLAVASPRAPLCVGVRGPDDDEPEPGSPGRAHGAHGAVDAR